MKNHAQTTGEFQHVLFSFSKVSLFFHLFLRAFTFFTFPDVL